MEGFPYAYILIPSQKTGEPAKKEIVSCSNLKLFNREIWNKDPTHYNRKSLKLKFGNNLVKCMILHVADTYEDVKKFIETPGKRVRIPKLHDSILNISNNESDNSLQLKELKKSKLTRKRLKVNKGLNKMSQNNEIIKEKNLTEKSSNNRIINRTKQSRVVLKKSEDQKKLANAKNKRMSKERVVDPEETDKFRNPTLETAELDKMNCQADKCDKTIKFKKSNNKKNGCMTFKSKTLSKQPMDSEDVLDIEECDSESNPMSETAFSDITDTQSEQFGKESKTYRKSQEPKQDLEVNKLIDIRSLEDEIVDDMEDITSFEKSPTIAHSTLFSECSGQNERLQSPLSGMRNINRNSATDKQNQQLNLLRNVSMDRNTFQELKNETTNSQIKETVTDNDYAIMIYDKIFQSHSTTDHSENITENEDTTDLGKGVRCNTIAYKDAFKTKEPQKFFTLINIGIYGYEELSKRCVRESITKKNENQRTISPTKKQVIEDEFYKFLKLKDFTKKEINEHLSKCNKYHRVSISSAKKKLKRMQTQRDTNSASENI